MAVGSIGSTFCVSIDATGDAAGQLTHTLTVGRPCQVLLIELIFTTVAAGNVTIQSDTTGSAGFANMVAATAIEINNVALVAQTISSGAGAMVLAPTGNATLTSDAGKISITTSSNCAYVARFICTAQTPTALTVTSA